MTVKKIGSIKTEMSKYVPKKWSDIYIQVEKSISGHIIKPVIWGNKRPQTLE